MSGPDATLIDHRTKGMPGGTGPLPAGDLGKLGWNVLRQSMPLPVAVLKESALSNNARWMKEFVTRTGVSLCPHGKTTMCPELFHRQLAGGAWGITLSTAHQVQVARDFLVSRILLANQIVDPRLLDFVLGELARDEAFDFYCLVDSIAGVEFIRARSAALGCPRPVQVLVERGVQGGRTGCRTIEEGLAVARAAKAAAPTLVLRGIEGFEGAIPGASPRDPSAVRRFVAAVCDLAQACDSEDLIVGGDIILSAGGSAYFDIVTEMFRQVPLSRPKRIVLRSGCYVTHDSKMYTELFDGIIHRSSVASSIEGQLAPALEILAYVQSMPEKQLAILTLGKRDCSYDVQLPIPKYCYRPGEGAGSLQELGAGFKVTALNDQHAYLALPVDCDLKIGDMIVLGISHPCTTFDKWDVLYGVDDSYNVVSAFKTFF
jgi:D-serine dehydratase